MQGDRQSQNPSLSSDDGLDFRHVLLINLCSHADKSWPGCLFSGSRGYIVARL